VVSYEGSVEVPVINPVVVVPDLRAGTCAVLRGSLLIVSV